MKKNWSEILTYGATLGLLLAGLQFFQYKWVFLKNAMDWYVGLIALVFTGIGIWAGYRFRHARKQTAAPEGTLVFEPAPMVIAKLGITPRELEVLQLIAAGLSNQEIAEKLFVSLNTVKTHISNLMPKLQAERRTQAIQNAKALGILP